MHHLFIPGPVDVTPEVSAAQTQPILPHRSEAFETIFHRAESNARKLFFTQHRVFITASSGTGLQEAAIRNFANSTVLSCVNGAFGERWHQVAVSNGKLASKLETAWNEPITPQALGDHLKEKFFEVVTIIHNETSTGLQNPVPELAAVVKEISPETLICVDAVSSLGGTKVDMDVWGLDMVLTSSQKCLALPPGLGLGAVSDRALERAEKVEHRGWYFDLLLLEKHRTKDSTPATPAISLIYALDQQLTRILSEGLETRFARHLAMAEKVRGWAASRGFNLYAPEGFRSNTVSAVVNSRDLDIARLNRFLLQKEMLIANGYGPLRNKTFRIAHMGETQLADIDRLLTAMDTYLST